MNDPRPNAKSSPKPVTHDTHPHNAHPHDVDCPDGYHRCHATFYGYIDCPDAHPHYTTEMLSVACGADDPMPQIQNFLSQPGHSHSEVVQVLDLGHNGWTVIFKTPV